MADREAYEEQGVRYRMNRRRHASTPLTERWKKINRARSRVRAFAEHPFLVVKHVWRFKKVRYRGLAKNAAHVTTMVALANLYRVRHRPMPPGATCVL